MLFFNVQYPANLRDFLRIFSSGRLEFLSVPSQKFIPELYDKNNLIESPPNFFDNDFSGLFF